MINEKFIQLLPKMNIQSAKYSREMILNKVIICFKCGQPHEHGNRFKKLPKEKRKTLTRDNGPEFGDYDKTLEEKTNMKVYRATPYSSCERGTNENWNGLLRQFFPKGSYFDTITQYQVQHAVRMLNDRPRKRLGYRTPREVFRGCSDSS